MVDVIKKNIKSVQESLFSSVGSSVLTIATSYLVLNFFRGMFGFIMSVSYTHLTLPTKA